MNYDDPIARALRYVGSYGHHEESGKFQFEMLHVEGLSPADRLLEVGCGCLNLGRFLVDYLDPDHYVGIEPNAWLVEAGRDYFGVRRPFRHVAAEDFDAGTGVFDVVYSHSVLSHAARSQLPAYLAACARQLCPGGWALASLRLSESRGGHEETIEEAWDYPNIRWFRRETVEREARAAGFDSIFRPDLREAFMRATRGEHHHDWVKLRRRA